MKHTIFGKTGDTISTVGFGAWGISGRDWGKTDDEKSKKAIHEAIDQGITFIDTADTYGFGHSEILISEVLKERGGKPDNLFIASKAGNNFYPFIDKEYITTPANPDYSVKHLTFAVEQSLKRLNLEVLNLLQLHSPPVDILKQEEPWIALEKLKRDGKIRFAGLSVQSFKETEQAFLLDEHHDVLDALQIRYNIMERGAEDVLLPKAEKYNMGVIARIPLLFGMLTGKFTRESRFGTDDHRQWNLSPEKLNDYINRFEKASKFYERYDDFTAAQISLAFTISNPACHVVIPGGKSPQQVRENARAADVDIPFKDYPLF